MPGAPGTPCPDNCGETGQPPCPVGCVCPATCPGTGGRNCPPGCFPRPGIDPCNSCTVTDSMVDMMIPVCPGRKKKRAILESALSEEGRNISPSPSSQSDIER